MNWTAKLRPSGTSGGAASSKAGPATATAKATTAGASAANARVSNGLKEFLGLFGDEKQPRILDLGNVSQSTLNFFIARGFRVSTEDLLRSWKEFLTAEEENLRRAAPGQEGEKISQVMLAEKFLDSAVVYGEESFDGVLAWDLLDYLDSELLRRLMDRLYAVLRPGGAVLAMFHSRTPERYHRYRILDMQSVELIPSATLAVHTRVFQNREMLDLFAKFRSSKTFVGRDQLREALFLK
ncbi:MAG: hypothetical protein ACRD4S_16115 [Candidatus Acidiferrales bacterium]